MPKYLFGARIDDPRYFQSFKSDYGKIGEDLLHSLKENTDQTSKYYALLNLMQVGIENSKTLAKQQVGKFNLDIDSFCKYFNQILENFEILSYRSLEYASTEVAYSIVKKISKGIKTNKESLDIVLKEKKVLSKLENNVGEATGDFWKSVGGLIESDLKNLLPALIEKREKDFLLRGGKYGPGYGGLLGESASYLLATALQKGENIFLNDLQKQLSKKNIKVEMIGKKGGKTDLKIGELNFSIKNYTALRNRFVDFKEGEKLSEEKSTNITIHSSGYLETVLTNFAKDTGINAFGENPEDFFVFVMNSIYFNQFDLSKGDSEDNSHQYYLDSMQILDILVNAYAYVFLAQGTSKNFGFMFQELEKNKKNVLPGFMWFVGKGIVPIYAVLQAIQDNFKLVLERQRNSPRSGVYGFLKISNVSAAIGAVDQLTNKRGAIYGDNQPDFNGRYYRRSFNTTHQNYWQAEKILLGRYAKFNEILKTSVKLHIQVGNLDSLIKEGKII